MTTLQFTTMYTHGARGLIGAYVLTVIAMGAALVQRRVGLFLWLRLPLRAALVCGLALLSWNIGRSYLSPLLRLDALTNACLGTGFLALFAYVAGLLSFRDIENAQTVRGATLHNARRSRTRHGVLRLAGINVPASDEAKHFKLLGTTGTGKSTAIRGLLRSALARATAPSSRTPMAVISRTSTTLSAAIRFLIRSMRVRPVGHCLASWKAASILNNSPVH